MGNLEYMEGLVLIKEKSQLEESLEKRGGKKFGPTGGRKLTIFLDDISMPEGAFLDL